MPPPALYDLKKVDFDNPAIEVEEIRKLNPQRFEMEMLSAIVLIDDEADVAVGYKDVGHDEFWAQGHMPDYPLMPGVLICEAAAQLCGYLCTLRKYMGGDFVGFGGMENVRFRGPVHPGDRLVLMIHPGKVNRRQVISAAQGFVGDTMVFHGDIIGVPLRRRKEA